MENLPATTVQPLGTAVIGVGVARDMRKLRLLSPRVVEYFKPLALFTLTLTF